MHSVWQVRRGFAATAGSSALRWRFPALWWPPPRLCSALPQAWFWRATLGHVTEFVDRHENAEIHGRRDDQKIQYRTKYRAERNRRIIECDCQQAIHIRFAEIMAMNGLITLLTIELTTVVTAPPMTTPTAMSIMLPRAMNFLNPSIMMILPLCETVRCCCERTLSHAFRISIL